MFNLLKPNSKFNFASKFNIAFFISAVIVFISLFLVITEMKYGVDFRGGAEIEVGFASKINVSNLRKNLKRLGYVGAQVQSIGDVLDNNFLIKVSAGNKDLNFITDQITKSLKSEFADFDIKILKVDIVGPKAGKELKLSGVLAMFWALLSIMVYISLRFDIIYAPGAIIALFHDVLIILGIFVLMKIEFTLQTVAALLAVIGYSVNDTVIVYDRVREHVQKQKHVPLKQHVNEAINNTLSRTILTSGTTLFVALSMLIFGGVSIYNFFLAITIGIVVGTYSSIFIAAPITLFFDKVLKKKDQNDVKVAVNI